MNKILLFTVLGLGLPAAAQAQQLYVSGSAGINLQSDSSNRGRFTSPFVAGNGSPAVPFGTTIASGTPLGWETKFDNGLALSAEFGAKFGGGFRAGIEAAYTKANVNTHRGVTVGTTNIDGVDAAVLVGLPTQLGATVGQVVDDGNGSIRNLGLFANGYFDIPTSSAVTPYIGAGLGVVDVKVRYRPSDVGIVDDSETRFGYQLMGGVSFAVSPQVDLFGQYTLRRTGGATMRVQLFDADLKVENKQSLLTAGLRLRF